MRPCREYQNPVYWIVGLSRTVHETPIYKGPYEVERESGNRVNLQMVLWAADQQSQVLSAREYIRHDSKERGVLTWAGKMV
jgi:hypothetical protein